MQIPKELTTVTTLSKTVALILFLTLPVVAFLLGMRYQTILTEQMSPTFPPSIISPTSTPISCTMEAKICPDGTSVGRAGPNCEFEACPSVPEGTIFCGGIGGKMCPGGYSCKYDGTYPDAGGTCIKGETQQNYTCPKSEYVDCMPGPGSIGKAECSLEFLQWAQTNCPNFKDAAY
ncbi:MAG: hypothetical protein V1922_04870 [bacterium]